MNPEIVPLEASKPHFIKKLTNGAVELLKFRVLPFCHRKWKLLTVLTSITVPFLILFIWILSPKQPEIIEVTARKGDLIQTVEAVGTVISENDLKLRFPVTGLVEQVLVEEGDTVKERQELAHLRNDALEADVASAQASLASEQAIIKELKEGTRAEDIAIQEAEVENKRASLDSARASLEGAEEKLNKSGEKLAKLRKEAEISLAGYIETSNSEASKQLTEVRSALRKLEDVLEDNAVERAASFYEPTRYSIISLDRSNALNTIEMLIKDLDSGFDDYKDTIRYMSRVRDAARAAASATSEYYSFLADLPLYQNYDSSERDTQKSAVTIQMNTIQDALSAIDAALKSIRDASADFDTQIAAEEYSVAAARSAMETAQADIQTYETSLKKQEAELAKKRAGARPTEIQAQQAKVNRAYAELNKMKAKLEDTIIRAPIDGTITKVNLKEGEFTGGLDINEFAMSMLGSSPYRVEMLVAEIDIPKVALSQTGSIDLDAFPDEEFVLHVSEIDPTATVKDGVSKYRVKLDLPKQDSRIKIGMTGDAEIFTDFSADAVIIPGRAVFTNHEGKEIVKIMDGNEVIEREVITGMEGEGGDIEVIEGVKEGETIILLIKD